MPVFPLPDTIVKGSMAIAKLPKGRVFVFGGMINQEEWEWKIAMDPFQVVYFPTLIPSKNQPFIVGKYTVSSHTLALGDMFLVPSFVNEMIQWLCLARCRFWIHTPFLPYPEVIEFLSKDTVISCWQRLDEMRRNPNTNDWEVKQQKNTEFLEWWAPKEISGCVLIFFVVGVCVFFVWLCVLENEKKSNEKNATKASQQ